jgi:hypothetical protein
LYLAHRYEDARAANAQAISLDPDLVRAYEYSAGIRLLRSEPKQPIANGGFRAIRDGAAFASAPRCMARH